MCVQDIPTYASGCLLIVKQKKEKHETIITNISIHHHTALP